ncbi:CRISPR-associated protein Cas4 [Nocardia halotolerans]|uniref:CRISPR-associated exonuclease Cas4 n=1 Tax=Nocardia halotolerans TaxID=1755878 RepID=A0ABV8VHR8_9NOCA
MSSPTVCRPGWPTPRCSPEMNELGDGAEVWSVPISAIEHYAYCRRQAVLIWQEAYFESNTDTVRGDLAHQAVDRGGVLTGRNGVRVWRSLPVYSDRLGMHGICDTVHWTSDGPVAVEHKSGTYRLGGAADLQVAAQVLCLREMFDSDIPHGEVFAGRDRQHHRVTVDPAIEARVGEIIAELRALLDTGALPRAVHDRRCRRCSLAPGCVPQTGSSRSVDLFTPRAAGEAL